MSLSRRRSGLIVCSLPTSTEKKEDFRETLVPVLLEQTGLPLAVLEYRLAPEHPHPAHITDVLAGLSTLTSSSSLLDCEQGSAHWDRNRLVLLGHSAGAFMCLQVLFDPPSGSVSPPVPPSLREKIEAAYLIDGIYDLPSLLDEYPSYVSFVSQAFGPPPSSTDEASDNNSAASSTYDLESPARWTVPPRVLAHTQLHLLHSQQDELLSLAQPELLLARVYESLDDGEQADGTAKETSKAIKVDYEALQGGHFEVVHGKADHLARYVAQTVRA